MRVGNSLEILQHTTNNFFQYFEFISAYIYDCLVLTKGDLKYQVQKLEPNLKKLKEIRLKCNTLLIFPCKNQDIIFRFMGNMRWN